MTSVMKRADARQPVSARHAKAAIVLLDNEPGSAQARATRAAQRRWRLKALACLRRKAR
jgi:hypothetical protein